MSCDGSDEPNEPCEETLERERSISFCYDDYFSKFHECKKYLTKIHKLQNEHWEKLSISSRLKATALPDIKHEPIFINPEHSQIMEKAEKVLNEFACQEKFLTDKTHKIESEALAGARLMEKLGKFRQ